MGYLKIGFVLDDTLDTPDGVQQYILTLGSWLKDEGHEVHYLVGQTERTDVPNVHSIGRNIKVRFNGNRMSTPLPASKRAIKRLLEREHFDIVHVQVPYSPFMAGRIIACAPRTTAVIGTFHIAPNSGSVSVANKLLGRLLKRSLRRFDSMVSVSEAAAQFAREAYGIESSILPNVVALKPYRDAKPLDLGAKKPTIVYLGRLVPRKGAPVLLEALSALRSNPDCPDMRVILCGRGPLDADLKSYVRTHGLQDMVAFTGFVSEEDKARYLKTADVAVFPSTGGESFGIVLIEAMAANNPVVIGADNPGYRTVLKPHPESLFTAGNAAALADSLLRYLNDANLQKNTKQWQQFYVRRFDVATVGPRLVARYREALRSRQSS